MIKEIEVGGVKYRITLADDMVGGGLKKESSGKLTVDICTGGAIDTNYYMTGLTYISSGLVLDKYVIANALVGTGLFVHNGKFTVSGIELSQDSSFVAALASGIAGSGLNHLGESLFVDLNSIVSTGLEVNPSGDKIQISTGIAGEGINFESGVISVKVRATSGFEFAPDGLGFKVAYRNAGLRLFFNEKGELDVTQN